MGLKSNYVGAADNEKKKNNKINKSGHWDGALSKGANL